MKFAIIIPASMESKRLPGKPLLSIGMYTLLQRTIITAGYTEVEKIVVASSSMAVEDNCAGHTTHFSSQKSHHSGTSRCAEALSVIDPSIELIVNWQVDEPFLEPRHVNQLVEMVASWTPEERATTIGTIVGPGGGDACPHCTYGYIQSGRGSGPCMECYGGHSRHVVKAAISHIPNQCYWFSRAPIVGAYNHIGVYCYHRELLKKLGKIKQSRMGNIEGLEQLDWLSNGYKIMHHTIDSNPLSINTFYDYEKAVREFSK